MIAYKRGRRFVKTAVGCGNRREKSGIEDFSMKNLRMRGNKSHCKKLRNKDSGGSRPFPPPSQQFDLWL
jgi:hypothetical protein